jgi:hypothetical protein
MAFKISEFRANLGKLARPNLFIAKINTDITGSISGDEALPDIQSTFSFRCESAELPGRTLATTDDVVGAGPSLKLPYDVTYNDMSLTIICSQDMKERRFFEGWIDRIVGNATSGKGGLINYYENYATGILEIEQLDEAGDVLIRYEMTQVYPIAVTAMTASWADDNTYQRFGVTMAYRYYTWSTGQAAAALG